MTATASDSLALSLVHQEEDIMIHHPRPSMRALRAAVLGASLIMASATSGVFAADDPSPSSQPYPAASTSPSPVEPALAETGYPLPDVFGDPSELPTVSLEPDSEAGWPIGVPQAFSLGHCGILSPVDVDGSLWAVVGASDAAGGPIEEDREIGELINATAGTLELTAADRAVFVSDSGQRMYFERAPGPLDYFLCQ